MSCYNCCTGVSLTSQLLLTRGKHADRDGDKSEHRFALQSDIRGDSEQSHFQDVGHRGTLLGRSGQPEPSGSIARAPKGLPWLQTSSFCGDLSVVSLCLRPKARGPARTDRVASRARPGGWNLLPLTRMKLHIFRMCTLKGVQRDGPGGKGSAYYAITRTTIPSTPVKSQARCDSPALLVGRGKARRILGTQRSVFLSAFRD